MPKPKNGKAKKEYKVVSSPRQTIAVKKLSEIVRKSGGRKGVTLGKILKEAGYSDSVCKAPQRVTERKGWKQLMATYFPDKELAKVEKEQLMASTISHYVFPSKEDDETIKEIIEGFPNCKLMRIRRQQNWKRAYFSAPDNLAVAKSLDRIYKLKTKYPAERHKITGKVKSEVKIIKVGAWKEQKKQQ